MPLKRSVSRNVLDVSPRVSVEGAGRRSRAPYRPRDCVRCGYGFEPTSGSQRWCFGDLCQEAKRTAQRRRDMDGRRLTRPTYEHRCTSCGCTFRSNRSVATACGDQCRRARHRERQRNRKIPPDRAERYRERLRWHDTNPERKTERRSSRLVRRYGMTAEEKDALFDSQGRKCAVCGGTESSRWHIDHDHDCCDTKVTCGLCVRGILCNNCNLAEGLLRGAAIRAKTDTTAVVEALAAYVHRLRNEG